MGAEADGDGGGNGGGHIDAVAVHGGLVGMQLPESRVVRPTAGGFGLGWAPVDVDGIRSAEEISRSDNPGCAADGE